MDKKQELEHKLEQARKDRELATTEANKEIEAIKAQLAEAEKPVKLRHGDYGFEEDGCARLTLSHDFKMVTAGDGCVNPYETHYPNPVLGNIFDDLKAISKSLKEFTLSNGVKIDINEYGHLRITDGDGYIVIHKDDIHSFILNLRCLEAQILLDSK